MSYFVLNDPSLFPRRFLVSRYWILLFFTMFFLLVFLYLTQPYLQIVVITISIHLALSLSRYDTERLTTSIAKRICKFLSSA